MPFLYSKIKGRLQPKRVLTVDVYVNRQSAGLLTPTTKSFGFKTYVTKEPSIPFLIAEDPYLEAFCENWSSAVVETAETFQADSSVAISLLTDLGVPFPQKPGLDLSNAISTALRKSEVIRDFVALSATSHFDTEKLSFAKAVGISLRTSKVTKQFAPIIMATRPKLQVTGLSGQSEDPVSAIVSPTDRSERKNTVLKRLRPPPTKHEWEFWHDKHEPDSVDAAKPGEPSYEDRLVMLHRIKDVGDFWKYFNNFPLANVRLRDTIHLFKKTVKPVWEDPRNICGGSWTFRFNKSVSAEAWQSVNLMAIGEVLQEAVEPGDDICGVSLSVRFNSHLISIWNRNASNQKSIDAICARFLEELPAQIKPAPSTFYYKKHSEHKGFASSTAGKVA
ncbi:MAG: hypothetical protein M1825_005982 [Sarcosagium campestre]|nr:MAG: hypothetical protein M1825_005982 [Sarcosagium campestre]